MTPLEKEIEKKLVDRVKLYGGLCLKLISPGWAGVPDRIVLLPGGRVHFVETKRPKGGVLSSRQRWWMHKLGALGFSYWVAWDADDISGFEAYALKGAKV